MIKKIIEAIKAIFVDDEEYYWQCQCGQENREDDLECVKCGADCSCRPLYSKDKLVIINKFFNKNDSKKTTRGTQAKR